MDEDVIVKEIQEAITLEKLVNRLYDSAYESYLSGKYEKAIMSFETAGILNTDKMAFWKKLALNYCYLATGRYRDAERLSGELMADHPAYWGAYFNAGLAALWQRKLKTAVGYLKRADDMDGHEPVVNVYLGMAYGLMGKTEWRQGQFDFAETAYQEIIQKNPHEEQAFIELAYLYLYSGKKKDILDLIQKAEEIIKDSDEVEKKQVWLDFYLSHLKGIYLHKNGKFHESVLMLGRAIDQAPSGIRLDLAESYYYLGKNYEALQQPQKTRQFYQKALGLDPLVPYAREVHSFLKSDRGKEGPS